VLQLPLLPQAAAPLRYWPVRPDLLQPLLQDQLLRKGQLLRAYLLCRTQLLR
jgi:hypothetical protein